MAGTDARSACPVPTYQCPIAAENHPRQKTHFASRLKRIALSSPATKNISLSFFPKSVSLHAVPPRYEGRFAVVTDVEAGCGGRVDVAAWFILAPTNGIDAHGQVAWS
jgi:hypothetical protein